MVFIWKRKKNAANGGQLPKVDKLRQVIYLKIWHNHAHILLVSRSKHPVLAINFPFRA